MLDGAAIHLVETADDAAAFIRWLSEPRAAIAIDTETSGLRPYAANGDWLRLVQFGDTRDGWVLSSIRWWGLIEQALKWIIGAGTATLWANANFDLNFLELAGLPVPPVHRIHDIYVMDHLLDPMRSHALKKIGDRMWPGSSAGQAALDDDFRLNKWTWATIPETRVAYWAYAGFDVVLTSRIAERLWKEIHERNMRPQYDREMAAQALGRRMEKKGLLIDVGATSGYLTDWTLEMQSIETELNQLGVDNPSSARMVAMAMSLTESWEPDDWTETGLPKLDEKILKGIDSDISRRVLRFRRLRKWTVAYLGKFLSEQDIYGRVHPNINTLRARTGRMSITGIPFQTLPSLKSGGTGAYDIRRCVIVPEGRRLWAVDYDTQELRIFASLADEPAYQAAFTSGKDLHSYVAQLVYQDETVGKGDVRREIAKNTQYARLYGAGAAKIAETANVTEAEVAHFIATFDETFTRAGEFIKGLDTLGRQRLAETGRPYVWSHGGRYLPSDEHKVYALLNYLIQGSAADVLKAKMIELDAQGYGDNMMLPVHDELLFDFPEGEVDGPHDVAQIMVDDTSFAVPLTTELSGPYTSWGEKYAPKG